MSGPSFISRTYPKSVVDVSGLAVTFARWLVIKRRKRSRLTRKVLVTVVAVLGAMLSTSSASAQSSQDHRLSGQATPDWRPELLVREQTPASGDRTRPVLYIHGSSFPSASSVMFRLDGVSWADALNAAGFSVFALDFAGYGGSERYPVMSSDDLVGTPPGRALEAAEQIARAVAFIRERTGASRVSVLAQAASPQGRHWT